MDFSQQGVIQLGTELWGSVNQHQFLFNHDFQLGMDLALQFIEKRKSVVLSGGKGVGKSCLGLIIVDTLFRHDHVVAYEYGDTQMLLIPSEAALKRFVDDKAVLDCFAIFSFEMVNLVGMYEFLKFNEGSQLFNYVCQCRQIMYVRGVGAS